MTPTPGTMFAMVALLSTLGIAIAVAGMVKRDPNLAMVGLIFSIMAFVLSFLNAALLMLRLAN
jgi:hypothetical protein